MTYKIQYDNCLGEPQVEELTMSETKEKKYVSRIVIRIDDDFNKLRLDELAYTQADGSTITRELNLAQHICKEYYDLSFGDRLNRVFDDPNIEIPSAIDVRFSFSKKMAKLMNIDEYLLKAAIEPGCKLQKYSANEQDSVVAEFHESNPRKLIAAMLAAIEENSAALGRKGTMLNISLPDSGELVSYYNKYIQHKKQ